MGMEVIKIGVESREDTKSSSILTFPGTPKETLHKTKRRRWESGLGVLV